MRVGLIIYDDLEKGSGGYLYDRKLVEHLRDSGDSVEIIEIPQKEQRLQNIEHNYSEELKKNIEDKGLDILIEDELCFLSLFQLNKKLESEVDIISVIHHLSHLAERDSEKKDMYKYFEQKYLETVDGFIFNSQASREAVKELVGNSIGVVANPGKDHFKQPESIEKDFSSNELCALFIGNFCPHKCVDVIIRAIGGVENVKLTLVGDPYWDEEYGEKIEKLISSLDSKDKIDLMGRVEKEKLLEELRKADVLLLPSLYEGFGISIIEALGYGTPVIATNRGGPPEMIDDGVQGFLVTPGDEEALKNQLKKLRDQPSTLQKMSDRAIERFRKLLTWDKSMKEARKFLCSSYDE